MTDETYVMNMVCNNCEGHSTMVFKRGEPCKYVPSTDEKKIKAFSLYLCPHCGCVESRATTRAGGI
jgi:hypothetical protein